MRSIVAVRKRRGKAIRVKAQCGRGELARIGRSKREEGAGRLTLRKLDLRSEVVYV